MQEHTAVDLLKSLFASSGFVPRGHCYLWKPGLVWLHLISDSFIALAFTCIPITLLYFIRKRRDLPFRRMFLCFGGFLIACGATHAMEVWTIWNAAYWLSGAVKAVTAFASVLTAVLLVSLIPEALALPSLAHWRPVSQGSEKEVGERRRAQREVALSRLDDSVSHDLRARRMGLLVEELLHLARLGRRELTLQTTGLNSIVEPVLADLKQQAAGRNLQWKIEPLPLVECDPGLLKQVFAHLLSNALKFTRTREQAVIEVGALSGDGQAVIFVRDNGVGFHMRHAAQLFGVFQRLHRQEDFEGSGLGLAMVRRIIHKHGGRIWAEAQLNRGACFYFTLGEPHPARELGRRSSVWPEACATESPKGS